MFGPCLFGFIAGSRIAPVFDACGLRKIFGVVSSLVAGSSSGFRQPYSCRGVADVDAKLCDATHAG